MTLGYYSGAGRDAGRDEAEWVAAGYPCRNCGGDLGGLHVTARCPQCGVPAGSSVFGDLLRFARPAWLGRVRAGLRLQLWTFIAAVVLSFLLITGLMAIGVWAASSAAAAAAATQPAAGTGGGAASWVASSDGVGSLMTWFGLGLAAVIGALLTVSVWRITEPEPSAADAPGSAGGGSGGRPGRTSTPARVARAAAVVSIIHVVVVGVVEAAVPETAAKPVPLVLNALLSLVHYVGWVALAYVLAALAVRAPDAGLAGRARIAAWGGAISGGLMEVLTLVVALAFGTGDTSASTTNPAANPVDVGLVVGGCGVSVLGLAVLGFFVVHLVTLGHLVSHVSRARAYAEQVWSGPVPSPVEPATAPLAMAALPPLPGDSTGQ